MLEFVELVVSFFEGVVARFDSVVIMSVGNLNITLWNILLSFIFLSIVSSVFWKGARG